MSHCRQFMFVSLCVCVVYVVYGHGQITVEYFRFSSSLPLSAAATTLLPVSGVNRFLSFFPMFALCHLPALTCLLLPSHSHAIRFYEEEKNLYKFLAQHTTTKGTNSTKRCHVCIGEKENKNGIKHKKRQQRTTAATEEVERAKHGFLPIPIHGGSTESVCSLLRRRRRLLLICFDAEWSGCW